MFFHSLVTTAGVAVVFLAWTVLDAVLDPSGIGAVAMFGLCLLIAGIIGLAATALIGPDD